MKAWIKLTTDDLALVFNAKELAVVAPSGPDSANPWTLDTLDDVTAMVRESIASNPANALDDDNHTAHAARCRDGHCGGASAQAFQHGHHRRAAQGGG